MPNGTARETDPRETAGRDPTPSSTSAASSEVLSVAIRPPRTLDPMRIADPGSVLVARQLYESLTRWDPVAQKVAPAAAVSWTASRGGRRFTFKLRRGMTFHDGSPVTAGSFQAAFDRIAQKDNASDLAYTLESVEGFFAVNGSGRRDHLRGVRAPDDLTLIFSLSRPSYAFPAVLTHPGLVPLSDSIIGHPRRLASRPVGNGPYRMTGSWKASGPIVLRAFRGSWQRPRIDTIRFVPFDDSGVSWFPFTQGRLDVAEVPVSETSAARKRFGDRGYVPLAAGLYFGLRLDSGALGERDLRAAISLAINRRELARRVFKDTLQAPRGIVPRGMVGFDDNACELCVYAPQRARRLVRDLPERSRDITVDFDDDPLQRRVARRVARDLERTGLNVTLKPWPIGRYLRRVAQGKVSMYRFGWIAEYPSADVFLSTLFASGSPDNHSGFDSREVDRLLAQARAEPKERLHLSLLRKAEKLILAEAPVVPLGSFAMRWAIQSRVRGLHFDSLGGFDAADVWLSTE